MMMMMVNSFILMFMSLSLFMFSLFCFLNKFVYVLEWCFLDLNSFNMEMLIYLDWISVLFISLVMMISSMVLLYSIEYMNNELYFNRFHYLLLLFIVSMVLMVISPNIVSIMIGWDGLGLISFLLVIFYQNFSSFKSGMLTVLCNRLGDIGLLFCIGLCFMTGSWNMMLYKSFDYYFIIFLMLAAITKSAQMPFSIWLPAAMAAPTPISSLVHSSTLVTAGVYLMIRFNFFLMISEFNYYLLSISLMTLCLSSMMALFEFDLKKIIALSTLSQLSMMMIILSVGLKELAFFHLITHAMFKSLLFLCAGLFIHNMNNNQDIRFYGMLTKNYPFTSLMFLSSSLSLSGFPFLSGFYSKDLILESSFDYLSSWIWLMLIFCSILTLMYSLRLIYYLFIFKISYFVINLNSENKIMNYSMLILFFCSIFMGSILNLIFFNFKVLVFNFIKLIIFLMILFGLIMLMLFMMTLKKIEIMNLLMSMFFMNYFYNSIYMPFKNFGLIYLKSFEKGWLDGLFSNFMFIFVYKLFVMNFSFISLIFVFIFYMIIFI